MMDNKNSSELSSSEYSEDFVTVRMEKYRIAARDIFNSHFFRFPNDGAFDAFECWEQFEIVEKALFQSLVTDILLLEKTEYGKPSDDIQVTTQSDRTPIWINRDPDTDHGHWDFPVKEANRETKMAFVSFFDFDLSRYADFRYALVKIFGWTEQPETVGRFALIETQYIRYKLKDN